MSLAKTGWHQYRIENAAGIYAPGVLPEGTQVPNGVFTFMRPAVVKEVVVNNPTAATTVELHNVTKVDGAAAPAAAAAKFVLECGDIPAGTPSYTIPVDIECKAGLFMRVTGNGGITVVYRPMGRTAPDAPKVFIQRR